jgi:hypothetical protein
MAGQARQAEGGDYQEAEKMTDKRRIAGHRQATEYLTANGFPISARVFAEMCHPSGRNAGRGPKPAGRFGRHVVFDADTLIEWAEDRLKQKCINL